MDANDAMTEYTETNYNQEEGKMDSKTIRLDGSDFELPTSAARAVELALSKKDAELNAMKAEFDNVKGQLDATKEEMAKAKKARADAEDPSFLRAAINARVALVAKAGKVLGSDEGLADLSDRQIKEKVISSSNKEMKFDSLSDEYISGRFDTVVESHSVNQEAITSAKVAVATATKAEPMSTPDALGQKHLDFLNAKKGVK